ncbi:Protein of unknown function [Chryseobacterium oleae]|uniref:DUF2975 domain-containing protein n=1 Tax=Chryseobacterium oleae TaxID=491207 RepID=A0A1I5A428_CHROL|nr:DUF2975 domain-containing protein [Chryseobacterium oleae]SFN56999.1 Protein of unknown function [Chryseobacterium oleae]
MKIIGDNSLVSWIKYPFLICAAIFCISSVWIGSLAIIHILAEKQDSMMYISEKLYTVNDKTYDILQVQYPFSNMVFTVTDSREAIVLALLNMLTLSFSLIWASKIINEFSADHIFTDKVVRNFKVLSFGLIIFGFITLLVDLIMETNQFDITPPSLSIGIGITLLVMKEIFVQGSQLKEQADLTI